LYILTFDREAEGQGSLYRILPTGEAATSTGVPSTTPPDTVIPPVTDEGEAEAEEGAEDEVNGNNDNNNNEDENSNENE
jgi:aldose sugar dehydrogenase